MTVLLLSSDIPTISTAPNVSSIPFVYGFEMTITSSTVFTLNPGCARGVTNEEVINYPSAQPNLPGKITVDTAVVGANGCYPLALSASGITNDNMFPVFVLGDSKGSNPTVAIVVTGNNFMLPGYDSYARVGLVYIDSGTFHILPMRQSGHYTTRDYLLDTPVNVLDGGASTTSALVDLTRAAGPIYPNWTTSVKYNATFTPDAQTDVATLGAYGQSGLPLTLQGAVAAAKVSWEIDLMPGIDTTISHAGLSYAVTSADDSLTLDIIGFTDDMSIQVNNLTL